MYTNIPKWILKENSGKSHSLLSHNQSIKGIQGPERESKWASMPLSALIGLDDLPTCQLPLTIASLCHPMKLAQPTKTKAKRISSSSLQSSLAKARNLAFQGFWPQNSSLSTSYAMEIDLTPFPFPIQNMLLLGHMIINKRNLSKYHRHKGPYLMPKLCPQVSWT